MSMETIRPRPSATFGESVTLRLSPETCSLGMACFAESLRRPTKSAQCFR